jgi:hypothetical protein
MKDGVRDMADKLKGDKSENEDRIDRDEEVA